jgi:hypothetical protein
MGDRVSHLVAPSIGWRRGYRLRALCQFQGALDACTGTERPREKSYQGAFVAHWIAHNANLCRKEMAMYRRGSFGVFALAVAGLIGLTASATAQTPQKSAKELITGTWTLEIADNIRRDGPNAPGFGPLPNGTAKFDTDGRYSVEIMPSSSNQGALSYSGSYTLDEPNQTLTLRIEESSLPNWRGTTQTGKVKFLNEQHLGWTTSVPLVASADFLGSDLVWARAK